MVTFSEIYSVHCEEFGGLGQDVFAEHHRGDGELRPTEGSDHQGAERGEHQEEGGGGGGGEGGGAEEAGGEEGEEQKVERAERGEEEGGEG